MLMSISVKPISPSLMYRWNQCWHLKGTTVLALGIFLIPKRFQPVVSELIKSLEHEKVKKTICLNHDRAKSSGPEWDQPCANANFCKFLSSLAEHEYIFFVQAKPEKKSHINHKSQVSKDPNSNQIKIFRLLKPFRSKNMSYFFLSGHCSFN